MVMMNMMRSTSMTSISGVVLMSIMGSPSAVPAAIAIGRYSRIASRLEAGVTAGGRLGNEANLQEAGLLQRRHRPANALVGGVHVTADGRLGQIVRGHIGRSAELFDFLLELRHRAIEQFLGSTLLATPINLASA